MKKSLIILSIFALLASSTKAYVASLNISSEEVILLTKEAQKKKIDQKAKQSVDHERLAVSYFEQKKYKKAEKTFKKVLKLTPNKKGLNHAVGNFYYLMGQSTKDINYKKATKFYQKAIKHYQKESTLTPNYPQNYNDMGLAWNKLKDYDQAVAAYQQAISIRENYLDAHVNLGCEYEANSEYPQAEEHFLKALSIDRTNGRVYRNLSTTYLRQDKFLETIELLEQAVKIVQDTASFYSNLTYAYEKLSRYEKIIHYLNQSLQKNPQDAEAYGNLSHCYILTKDYKKAELSAIKGLNIDHTQTWIKANLATSLLFQGNYEEAKNIYQELREMTCLGKPCDQGCLDDFEEYEKAGVIPESQKENVERIRQWLNSK